MTQEMQSWADIRMEVWWGEGCRCPLMVDRMLPDLLSAR